MKKFILAILALVTVVFSACKMGGNGSDYYIGRDEPKIDAEKGTVNGVKYDNKTAKCWEWIMTAKTQSEKQETYHYVWGTQFQLVAICEMAMFTASRTGIVAEYAYVEAPKYKTEEACEEADVK